MPFLARVSWCFQWLYMTLGSAGIYSQLCSYSYESFGHAMRINFVFHKWELKNVHGIHIVCSTLPLPLQSKEVITFIQEGLGKEEKPRSCKGPALPWCHWTVIPRCEFLPKEEMDQLEPWFEKHDLRRQRWTVARCDRLLLLPWLWTAQVAV